MSHNKCEKCDRCTKCNVMYTDHGQGFAWNPMPSTCAHGHHAKKPLCFKHCPIVQSFMPK